MLFFGILRNAIWKLFTILSHDFTLWKLDEKRFIFGANFGSTSRVLSESAKIPQESPQTRKEVEKGSKNGSLLRWQKTGKGWYKCLKGSFLHLPVVRCAFGLQFFTNFTSFQTSEMNTFGSKSDLFLRPVVAYVHRLRTFKKTREFLPVSHGYGLLLRCPRNGSQCFTSGCKPQFSAGGPFL